jgi:predicted ArsR family transcriptional regulator
MKRIYSERSINVQLVIEAFKSDGYLILNKTLIQQLGLHQALVLSNLIDKCVYFYEHTPEYDGEFYLTHDQQSEQIGLSDHQIREAKRKLVAMGYVRTYLKGTPAKEWYILNFEAIGKGLVLQKLKDLSFKNLRTYKEIKYKDNNIISKDKKTAATLRNNEYKPLAERLSKIVCQRKNMRHTSRQILSWCNDIRRLVEENNITIDRINLAVDWYELHIGEQYTPVIESGAALRDKFTKLESAMERTQKKYKPKQPPHIIHGAWRYDLQTDGSYRNKKGDRYEGDD